MCRGRVPTLVRGPQWRVGSAPPRNPHGPSDSRNEWWHHAWDNRTWCGPLIPGRLDRCGDVRGSKLRVDTELPSSQIPYTMRGTTKTQRMGEYQPYQVELKKKKG